jgi:hypothetical protein
VTARHARKVDSGSSELLASFELNVAGNNRIDQFLPRKEFTGTRFAIVESPDADAAVTFVVTANEPWNTDGEDHLRREKRFDDVSFENEGMESPRKPALRSECRGYVHAGREWLRAHLPLGHF